MIRLGSFGESIVAQAVNCAEFFNSIDPMQPFEFADANGSLWIAERSNCHGQLKTWNNDCLSLCHTIDPMCCRRIRAFLIGLFCS